MSGVRAFEYSQPTTCTAVRRGAPEAEAAGRIARRSSAYGILGSEKQEGDDMNRVEYVKPDFPLDAFAGTATYYLRYRVPYPEALLLDLVERTGVTGEGRVLDLACGPGRVALAKSSNQIGR